MNHQYYTLDVVSGLIKKDDTYCDIILVSMIYRFLQAKPVQETLLCVGGIIL